MNTPLRLLLIILSLLVVGCSIGQSASTQSAVLQNNICTPPCWGGIIPGVTTLSDAAEILVGNAAVDSNSVKFVPLRATIDAVDFDFLPSTREFSGRVISTGGVVQCIYFFGQKIPASTIHNTLGAPDSYLSIYHQVERPYLFTFFIYNEGIIYSSDQSGIVSLENKPKLEDEYEVEAFWYCNQDLVSESLTNGVIDFLSEDDLSIGLHPWGESGDIQYLVRP